VTSYLFQETFYINFFGDTGTLYVDPFNGLFIQRKNEFIKKKINISNNYPEQEEICDFYKAIQENKKFDNPTPEESLANVEVVEKILNFLK